MDEANAPIVLSPQETPAGLTSKHWDVIIVGSGAGGASVAHRLAKTGKSILVLERGQRLPIEPENWSPAAVWINSRYRTKEKWLDKKGKEFRPNTHYWAGGNTMFYGAALMRFRKRDFEEVTHADGISPAWPIRYEDLAPHYTEAERLWSVHGARGADPTDDADAPAYEHAPLAHDPGVLAMRGIFLRRGWKPYPLPLGLLRNEEKPWESPCIRCTTCGGHPCLRMGKSDARRILTLAEQNANVVLLTGRKALRVETDASGRTATAVVCETEGGEERFRGDIIVLAAGAVNSAALLLKSHSPAHPNGLANGSDQVGRNYMFHTSTATISVSPQPVQAPFPKTMGLSDFYWNDPEGGFEFPMGHVQLLEFMSADTIKGHLSSKLPAWFIPTLLLGAMERRMIAFLTMSEDLPLADNRVRVTSAGRIALDYTFNNLPGHLRLRKKLRKTLDEAGLMCHCLHGFKFSMDELLPLYGTAHQNGTVRMGDDPAAAPIDRDCKAHELDNLYVADASVFCSSAAVNPTLTLVANAMRVTDGIARRLS